MPISPFHDEQSKELAADLASIEIDEEVDNSVPLMPTMSANCPPPTMYSGVPQLAAFSMLSPDEFLAAKRQAAAFLSQIPTFFPHHPANLFPTWGAASPQGINLANVTANSPPVSPLSPINTHIAQPANQQSLRVTSPTTTAHPQMMRKKTRKLRVKKDISSPSMEVSMSINDLYSSTGTLSPPSSGSSPNSSAHDVSIPRNNANKDGTPREKSFSCKICQRCFGYKHVLQNHERTHTGEKPFRCPECNKRFTRDHHLKTHMRLHTGEKPYKCDHCDRQFVQVANLRRHLRVHTGERPYICKMCNGKFSDSNQLKSHMLVHNGEKPFKCDKCHMKFKRRHYLLNHKCGMQSPVAPNFSPNSLYISEESMDTSKALPSHAIINYASISENEEDGPLDLSEDVSSQSGEPRSRRANDIRRVFHLPPPQIPHVNTDMPEQTEPEDLSMHLRRNNQMLSNPSSAAESPEPTMGIVHNDFDFDELDNAASIYMRQQSHLQ